MSNAKRHKRIAAAASLLGTLFVFTGAPLFVSAQTILKDPNAPVENRFVVGPAKVEVEVNRGESKQVFVDVENRMGRTESFNVHFEDFAPAKDPGHVVDLLGMQSSATSLKDNLSVPEKSFMLDQGDRVRIPVSISIPGNANPGDHLGAVVISARATAVGSGETSANAVVLGQVAVLLFVTVPGEIKSDAELQSFTVANNQKLFFGSPVGFHIAVKNSGTVHVNPYGGIMIKNMLGKTVATTPIDPWFVLPGSVRTRDLSVPTDHLFGWYTATLEENRGYNDVVDTASVSFVALNPATLLLLVLVLIGGGLLIRQTMQKKS